MSWLLLFSLTAVTFFNRYFFLEPKTAFQFPNFLMRMLKFAAPCLMLAICAPVIFFEQGEWRGLSTNLYFYGAVFTILITAFSKKMLLSLSLSLLFFYLLIYVFS